MRRTAFIAALLAAALVFALSSCSFGRSSSVVSTTAAETGSAAVLSSEDRTGDSVSEPSNPSCCPDVRPDISVTITASYFRVYDATSSQLIQQVDFDQDVDADFASSCLVVEDMNFDGYVDIRFPEQAAAGIPLYDCYLYDPASGRYTMNKDLSGVSGIGVDTANKHITGYEHLGADESYETVYEWQNGVLTLISRTAV